MYEFLSPATCAEAIELLKEKKNLRILAGGTDLIIALRTGVLQCDYLMDIKEIPELRKIAMTDAGLEVGAAVCLGEMIESGLLQGYFAALGQSADSVANVLLRNRATMAGNICNASPVGDMLPSALVCGGLLHTMAPSGERIIPLREFFTGVKKHVLAADEMVVKTVFPVAEGHSAFRKKKRIRGHDLAQASVAASLSGGVLKIAFGAAAPTPVLAELDPALPRDEIIEKAMGIVSPISDVRSSKEYRLAMLRYLAAEVLEEVFA